MVEIVIQVLAVVFGLIGAVLWWWSTRIGLRVTKDTTPRGGEDGDMAVRVADGIIYYNYAAQSRANAWAALFTGLSVAAFAIGSALQAVGFT